MNIILNEFMQYFQEVTCYNYLYIRSILHEKANCRKKGLNRIVPLFPPILLIVIAINNSYG